MKKTKIPERAVNPSASPKSGQLPKPVIIALISIGALIILSLLIFLVPQFVGKAITYLSTIPEDQAGIFLVDNTVDPNTDFNVIVKANIDDKETVAVGFVLDYTGLELDGDCGSAVTSLLTEWGDSFQRITCQDNKISFEHATVNYKAAKKNTFDIAEIKFKGAKAGTYNLKFDSFDIIDLNEPTRDLIEEGTDATIEVKEAECSKQEFCIYNETENCISKSSFCEEEAISAGYEKCTNENMQMSIWKYKFCEETSPEENPSEEGCTTNADCSQGQVCDTTTGICEECTDDSNCSSGQVCLSLLDEKPKCLTSCTTDNDCGSGFYCNATHKVCLEKISPSKELGGLSISLSKGGTLITGQEGLTPSTTYQIKATVTPSVDLTSHLVIAQVTIDNTPKSIYWSNMPALTKDTSETIQFTYQVPPDTTGKLKVKAFVWNSWLDTPPFQQLIKPAEINYTIS